MSGQKCPLCGERRLTYSLTEAAALIPCSERWLAGGLRSGRFLSTKLPSANGNVAFSLIMAGFGAVKHPILTDFERTQYGR
jgi:hypothetical protein